MEMMMMKMMMMVVHMTAGWRHTTCRRRGLAVRRCNFNSSSACWHWLRLANWLWTGPHGRLASAAVWWTAVLRHRPGWYL